MVIISTLFGQEQDRSCSGEADGPGQKSVKSKDRRRPDSPMREPAASETAATDEQHSLPANEPERAYVHLSRFLVVNIAALALLVGAWLKGWLGMVVAADRSYMTLVIIGVFVFGLYLCGSRMIGLSRFVARLKHPALSEPRRTVLLMRIGVVRHIANNLVLLGLIGTVLGFVIAFAGIEPGMIGDTDMAAGMITQVVDGMGVALYTTLVGAIAHIWLYGCYKILEHAATAAWMGEPC
jgi:hypothetical protein